MIQNETKTKSLSFEKVSFLTGVVAGIFAVFLQAF
jgi:hypothetical protein